MVTIISHPYYIVNVPFGVFVTIKMSSSLPFSALIYTKNSLSSTLPLNSYAGGVANFQIFGIKQEDDCEVQISSYETGKTPTAIYPEAYKILKRAGQVVDTQLLSKDTYKRH